MTRKWELRFRANVHGAGAPKGATYSVGLRAATKREAIAACQEMARGDTLLSIKAIPEAAECAPVPLPVETRSIEQADPDIELADGERFDEADLFPGERPNEVR